MAYVQLTHKKLFDILKDYKDGRLTTDKYSIITYHVTTILSLRQKSGYGLNLRTSDGNYTFRMYQLKYDEKSKIIKIKDVSIIGYISK